MSIIEMIGSSIDGTYKTFLLVLIDNFLALDIEKTNSIQIRYIVNENIIRYMLLYCLFYYKYSLHHKTRKKTEYMSHFIHKIMVFDCRIKT